MGINFDQRALERELDTALRDAATGSGSRLWADRVRWLGEETERTKGKTYIAALGAALLARATDPRVDTLTQRPEAGLYAYALRPVAEFLQGKVRGRVHLGTLSKNPVNNRPFNGGPARIDRFRVATYTRHVWDEYRHWLGELNECSQGQAHDALVAFLHERSRAQRTSDAAASDSPRLGAARSLDDLLEALQLFITEDPEEGGRGQALVGAVLDCAFDDVEVVPKHHPAPFDVKRAGKPPPLAVEVKQTPVKAQEVADLPRRAATADCERAIYAALDPSQPPLPVDRLRADALRDHGVLLDVCTDLGELAVRVGAYSGTEVSYMKSELPKHAVARCRTTGVSVSGQARLSDLLKGVATL